MSMLKAILAEIEKLEVKLKRQAAPKALPKQEATKATSEPKLQRVQWLPRPEGLRVNSSPYRS